MIPFYCAPYFAHDVLSVRDICKAFGRRRKDSSQGSDSERVQEVVEINFDVFDVSL
jgi:hypothetical protein